MKNCLDEKLAVIGIPPYLLKDMIGGYTIHIRRRMGSAETERVVISRRFCVYKIIAAIHILAE